MRAKKKDKKKSGFQVCEQVTRVCHGDHGHHISYPFPAKASVAKYTTSHGHNETYSTHCNAVYYQTRLALFVSWRIPLTRNARTQPEWGNGKYWQCHQDYSLFTGQSTLLNSMRNAKPGQTSPPPPRYVAWSVSWGRVVRRCGSSACPPTCDRQSDQHTKGCS